MFIVFTVCNFPIVNMIDLSARVSLIIMIDVGTQPVMDNA